MAHREGEPAAQVAKHEDVDTSDEPLRRIHGFWQTFHRGTRKGDPRPVTPVAQQKATETFLGDVVPESGKDPKQRKLKPDDFVQHPLFGVF